jgi:uncharacterized protein YhfF
MDIDTFWQAYLSSLLQGKPHPEKRPPTWYFSDNAESADHLGELVLRGLKTGTASLYWSYTDPQETLPRPGELSIITDFDGQPLCLIETIRVEVLPFIEVGADHAAAEGEGDLSLDYWRQVHWEFFERECKRIGRKPGENMPVVCERFQVVFRRPSLN